MPKFFGLFKDKDEEKKTSLDEKNGKKDESSKDNVPAGFGGSAKAAKWATEEDITSEKAMEKSESVKKPGKPTLDESKKLKSSTDDAKQTRAEKDSSDKAEKVETKDKDEKKEVKEEKTVSVQDEPDLKSKAQKTYPKNPTKPIIVSFVSNGKKINNDFIFTDKLGTHLKTSDLPTIPGYKLNLKTDLNYSIGLEEQRVTLHYIQDKVKYSLVPVTEDGKTIDKTKIRHFEGVPDSKVSSDKYPVIKGYRAYTSRKYQVPRSDGDVKVVYTPTRQTIHVTYRTSKGEVLRSYSIPGKTGEKYAIDPKKYTFPGYALAKIPKNLSGVFAPESMNVVIECEPIDSKIVVSFLDETGNPIHAAMEYSKKYKDSYHIKLPTTDGYELVSDPSLLNGYYDKTTKNIALRYKRATAKFNINFWFDKEFKHSAGKSRKVSGLVGNTYDVQVPELEGYKPNVTEVKGEFNAYENKDIDIVYSKIPTEVHITLVDEADRPLPNVDQIVKKGFWGEEFVAELPEIPGFTRPFKELKKKFNRAHQAETVHYTAQEVMLTIKYIDAKTGKEIAGYPSQPKPGLAGTAYNVDGEMIDGYRLTGLPENHSGIYTAKPITVELRYEPNPSEIVIHRTDSTLETIRATETLSGYYGQPYNIPTDDIPGYKFVSASDELKGKFPASRLDIYLQFEAADVKFTLVPVNQFGKEIDPVQNVEISGKAGQEFSHDMPEIPGYISTASEISGKIKISYQDEKIKVPYSPKQESITVHTIYAGGNKDGMHPFQDFTQPGPMGDKFEYEVPELPGYEPSTKKLVSTFTADPQELTVVYSVKQEEYLIQFVDANGKLVGGMPKGKGFYKQAIDVSKSVPRGFHLPDGVDSHIYLDGSNNYRVGVIADVLTVELIAQSKDGIDLGARRQIDGNYHEVKTVDALPVPGYNPVNGGKVSVKFEIGQTTIPVVYEPEDRTLTIRYINSTTGKPIKEAKKVQGKFNGEYDVTAPEIPGFVAINRTRDKGTFGLQDVETVFLYRAGSDELNRAITDIDEIVKRNQNETAQQQAVVRPTSRPIVETPPYDENQQIPTATVGQTFVDTIPNAFDSQVDPSTLGQSVSQAPELSSNSDDGVNLLDKLYGTDNNNN